MKRVPPVIGYAILEKEDVQEMHPKTMVKLAFVYGGVIGSSIGLIVGGLL